MTELIHFILNLRGPAAYLLHTLAFSAAPLSLPQLALHSGWARPLLAHTLDCLVAGGLALRLESGWAITPGARRELLRLAASLDSESLKDLKLKDFKDIASESRDAEPDAPQPAGVANVDVPQPPGACQPAPGAAPAAGFEATASPDPPPDGDTTSNGDQSPDGDTTSNGDQSPDGDTTSNGDQSFDVDRILAATPVLFGEAVMGSAQRFPDAARVLGLIAETYDRRARFDKPARVVFANLKRGYHARAAYAKDPLRYLPEAFLRPAGLLGPDPPAGEPCEDPPPGAEIHEPAEPPTPPSPTLALQAGSRPELTASAVWELAVGQLRLELQPAVFLRRVQPLRLLSFEPEGTRFVLAAPDEKARAWCASRLGKTLEHLLTGICAQPAAVEFTCQPAG